MKIAVVGTGYVGLVTGACLADFGNHVTCVDVDEEKIAKLQKCEIPIYEPGLDHVVERNVSEGRLRFSTAIADAIESSRAVFIAVGTPPGEDGSADLTYVRQVADTISRHVNGSKLVITKSTVPIGTGELLSRIFEEKGVGEQVSVVSNPEFLREGSAIEDFMRPDRLVIGAEDEESIRLMKQIYQPLDSMEFPFVITNIESAELIKYAANGFLATKISFINEVAQLCEIFGADVEAVARGMGLDTRIGPRFLKAGPGYGGSCFPKDVAAIVDIARRRGQNFEILEAVLRVNDRVRRRMIDKVADAVDGVSGKRIGVLGLSFKPETDDIRESPAITLIEGLLERGAEIAAYDPEAMAEARVVLPDVDYASDAYGVAAGADALVIVTEWNEFRALDLDRIRDLLRSPVVIDLRNIYDPHRMREAGFEYTSVGRENVLRRENISP